MLKPKKKITKKDLKEDKFVKFSLQAKTYLDENSKQVFTAVVSILAVILIIVVFVYVNNTKVEEARAQLGIAQVEYSNINYEKAITRLQKLISEYSGTNEADQGLFLLANIYYQQEKYEDAKLNFEQFIDSYTGSNILLASGLAGLAACYEQEKNYSEAAEIYTAAAEKAPDFVEADNYLYLSGLCFDKAGNSESAIQKFEKIVNDPVTQNRVNDAKVQLKKLQNKI